MKKKLPIALSVAITSLAVIAFQLVIMQMLSISQWHHFAYMVISMALLGFGAAGTFLALFREFLKNRFETVLPLLYLFCAVFMALSVRMVGLFGDFDTFLLFFDPSQIGLMIFSYLTYCLPFFFGGLAITLVFYHQVKNIGLFYFFNLAGSALGALVVIAFFWMMPLAYIPALLSLFPLMAAWMVRPGHRSDAFITLLALLVTLSAFIYPVSPRSSEYKSITASLQLPDAKIIDERSGPYGLLQTVRAPAQRFAPALSLQYPEEPPVRDILFNNGEYFGTLPGRCKKEKNPEDSDVTTSSSSLDDNHRNPEPTERGKPSTPKKQHLLDYTTRGLPYAVRLPSSVLVLKAGTGNDVSHAHCHEVSEITAVEPHRQANHLLKNVYPEWTDSLYHQPEITLYGNSVRTWFAAHKGAEKDLIVFPVLGAFGGTSGVYSLQEHYHLTREAFQQTWEHLSDTGVISVTVWAEYPPRKALKLLATWRKLLDEEEVLSPEKHIMAIRNWGTLTFLLSRAPFSAEEREAARNFSRIRSFDLLFTSDVRPEERDHFHLVENRSFFDDVDSLIYGDADALIHDYLFNIAPATDNRPFFLHFTSFSAAPELLKIYGSRELPYIEIGFVMAVVTAVQIFLASVVLIILPLFRVGWQGTRRRWTFLYFAGIGTGFMFFEMVLIQKLVLYLGQPVYATAAVLAILLISSGMGSYFSSRMPVNRKTLVRIAFLILSLIVGYALLLLPFLTISISWLLPLKIINVAIFLAIPGFFMGMMFPLGLRSLSGSNETQIPWACGVDSCLSVTATALATLIALESGFMVVMGIAALAYGVTMLAAFHIEKNGE